MALMYIAVFSLGNLSAVHRNFFTRPRSFDPFRLLVRATPELGVTPYTCSAHLGSAPTVERYSWAALELGGTLQVASELASNWTFRCSRSVCDDLSHEREAPYGS